MKTWLVPVHHLHSSYVIESFSRKRWTTWHVCRDTGQAQLWNQRTFLDHLNIYKYFSSVVPNISKDWLKFIIVATLEFRLTLIFKREHKKYRWEKKLLHRAICSAVLRFSQINCQAKSLTLNLILNQWSKSLKNN